MYGTIIELAERQNIKPQTIRYYSSPAHKRRIKQSKNALMAIELEEGDD